VSIVSHIETIRDLADKPEELELAYRQAVRDGTEEAFTEAIEAGYAEAGSNVLLAAWHFRLAHAVEQVRGRIVAWGWALPLGVLNGLLLWLLSDDQRFRIQMTNPLTGFPVYLMPAVLLLAVPVSAVVMSLFLTFAGRGRPGRTAVAAVVLAVAAAYVLLLFRQIWPRPFQDQFLGLMVMHLGLLAWAGVGFTALARGDGEEHRFAFLAKSMEAFVVAGLLAIAGGLFTAITIGLFNALDIQPPDVVFRLFYAGGGGLIAILAVALVYNPLVAPARQRFDEGLSKLFALLMRLLLPLTVVVLLVYLAFIPFNWREPFENRDVLVIYNAMLFAVIALLAGVTPVRSGELGEKGDRWLRRGVIALAALALIVSVYALAAIVYRTANDRITPNRLLFIGWNLVNIAVLAILLARQARAGRTYWVPAMHRTFAAAAMLYLAWAVAGLLVTPWLFRGDPRVAAGLPRTIQTILYERPEPILLKCPASPHVYLLERGQKRWIKDIATLTAEGYRWSDVQTVSPCADLRAVPDGVPIPPDAGAPPVP